MQVERRLVEFLDGFREDHEPGVVIICEMVRKIYAGARSEEWESKLTDDHVDKLRRLETTLFFASGRNLPLTMQCLDDCLETLQIKTDGSIAEDVKDVRLGIFEYFQELLR